MDFKKVQRFSGPLTEDDLKLVDYYIGENIGIFIPNGGLFEYALDPHKLPSYMFAFMFHERAYVCIDEKLIPLRPGGLLAVSPGVEHYEVPLDIQSRYVCVNIDHSYLENLYKKYTDNDIPEYRGEYYEYIEDLYDLIKSYIYEYEQRDIGYEEVCLSIENIIINKILRSIVGKSRKKIALKVRKEVEKSIQYMYHHLHGKIKLEDLCDDVGMSVSQYSKVFKEEIGMSPMEYLSDIRLERSRRLILLDNTKISEVAGSCGFSSVSYFTQKFREKYKLSPSEFKKIYKSEYNDIKS